MLFKELLPNPFEAAPAVHEDKAADVFVESEDYPHCYESPAKCNTEDIAADYLYSPHHDDSQDDREIDVSGTSECIYAEEVEGTTMFKYDFHP